MKAAQVRIVRGKRIAGDLGRAVQFALPCFLIDGEQNVKGIEEEMPRATRGVKDPQVAWVLLLAEAHGDRLLEHCVLAELLRSVWLLL